MPSNTVYNPGRVADFEKSKLHFNAQGVSASCAANSVTNIDLLLTDDNLITGIAFVTNNGLAGDFVNVTVIDTTGSFTGVVGKVMLQPVTNWYVSASADENFNVAYPAKLLAGMTLRLAYTSTSLVTPVFCGINYELHLVLV